MARIPPLAHVGAALASAALAAATPTLATAETRLFVNMVSIVDGSEAAYEALQRDAEAFWARYQIVVVARIEIDGDQTQVGDGAPRRPDVIEILQIETMDQFRAYVSDPAYQPLREARAEMIAAVTTMNGPPVGAPGTPLTAPRSTVAFADLGPASSSAARGRWSATTLDGAAVAPLTVSVEGVRGRVGEASAAQEAVDLIAIVPHDGAGAPQVALEDAASLQVFTGRVLGD